MFRILQQKYLQGVYDILKEAFKSLSHTNRRNDGVGTLMKKGATLTIIYRSVNVTAPIMLDILCF